MNAIFCVISIVSLLILTITSPNSIVGVLTGATQKAVELSISLLAIYSLWLGVFEVIKSGSIGRLLAKILDKPVGKLFGKIGKKTKNYICLNLAANFLGLGSIATPLGIKAQSLLEEEKNTHAQSLLFVLATTPIQLLPLTVIGLASKFGSKSPQWIILPCLLTTIVGFVVGTILVKIFCKK